MAFSTCFWRRVPPQRLTRRDTIDLLSALSLDDVVMDARRCGASTS
jgi:hypothetical protein